MVAFEPGAGEAGQYMLAAFHGAELEICRVHKLRILHLCEASCAAVQQAPVLDHGA